MAYTLSNMCATNLCKRTVLVQLIIKNVVTCFLEHRVEGRAVGLRPTNENVKFLTDLYEICKLT